MLLPVNWIKKYVDVDISTRDLADALTLSGSHVESIKDMSRGLDRIVLGKVLEITKHPDAEKLVVCKIDVGKEVLQIVTGAPNIKKEAGVIVALEGSQMADGTLIEASSLRGVESRGMCCSYQELGISESLIPKAYRDGIVLLNTDLEPGTPICEVLGFDDEVLELEITPNRPDCLSVLGMARETSAATSKTLSYPEFELGNIDNEVAIEGKIETDKCSNLVLAAITGVEIKESPLWIQSLLIKAGIRPINNIVDITNFVMLEFGQPLHAYDLDKLEGNELIVREALDGEDLVSLDGETRKLVQGDIVIADKSGIIGLAGVMGGFDTEVTEKTTRVLIESASFDKTQIRKTSDRLNLRSEASSRFSKYVSPSLNLPAAKRALYLAREIGVGNPSSTIKISKREDRPAESIRLSYSRVNDLLGTSIGKKDMVGYLERLGFEVEEKSDYCLVDTPGFRSDIAIEEDLIEEIGRLYGFHNIKPQPIKTDLVKGRVSKEKSNEYRIKNDLFALGYSEVLTYSFVSPSLNKRAGLDGEQINNFIKLLNPLGEEYSVMRTSILPNLIEILSRNIKNKCQDLRVFELGNVFIKGQSLEGVEKRRLSLASYGDVDFYSFKADFLELMARAGIRDIIFKPCKDLGVFHQGRCAEMTIGTKLLGYMGELSYATREEFSINKRAYGLEADLDLINNLSKEDKVYQPIVKFPSIIRDISVVVDKDMTHDEIVTIIRKNDDEIIADIRLIDIYTGQQLAEDEKSYTYQIVYRSKNRTLVDEEVNEIQERIIRTLEEDNIYLRK